MTIDNQRYHSNGTVSNVTGGGGNDDDYVDFYFNNTGNNKIYQNYLLPQIKLYDSKISINHWQLRDSVKASSNYKVNNDIYYIYDHSVRKINTGNLISASKQGKDSHSISSTVVNFNFKPRCFTEKNGMIVCGGLVGPDDRGFPSNWNNNNNINNSAGVGTTESVDLNEELPCRPVSILNDDVLSDNTNYSNPSLWKGIIQLYDVNSNVSQSLILGQFITNCVSLLPISTNQYDLFSCNNDNHMYQCNISNNRVVLTKRYSDLKFALNYVALSNDSQTMVVSGDTNKFAIYKKNELNNVFTLNYDTQPHWGNSTIIKNERIPRFALPDNTSKLDLELSTANSSTSNICGNTSANINGGFFDRRHIYEAPNSDHGFYTSFSNNDMQFSTIFQNGVCLIYDTRNMSKPMIEINSTRPYSHSGSFRVCKYSNSIDDLLFITEHQSRIHVIDTRNFTNHQVVSIPAKTDSTSGNNFNDTDGDFEKGELPEDVTSARKIPIQQLIPRVAPYPKVSSKTTNEYNSLQEKGIYLLNDEYIQNTDRHLYERHGISAISSNFFYNYNDTEADDDDNDDNSEDREVIRYNSEKTLQSDEGSYNFGFRLQRIRTNSFETDSRDEPLYSNEGSRVNNDEYIIDSILNTSAASSVHGARGINYSSHLTGFPLSRRGATSLWNGYSDDYTRDAISSYVTLESADENNICGLDCMQDSNGNDSLIVGYDYGILQWDINSWARRSFSSYEFA